MTIERVQTSGEISEALFDLHQYCSREFAREILLVVLNDQADLYQAMVHKDTRLQQQLEQRIKAKQQSVPAYSEICDEIVDLALRRVNELSLIPAGQIVGGAFIYAITSSDFRDEAKRIEETPKLELIAGEKL
jgi:hypothetical protein